MEASMKLLVLGLMLTASLSSFAKENCGVVTRDNGRIFISDLDGRSTIQVIIPDGASKSALKLRKSKKDFVTACLYGEVVKDGRKKVFVAIDAKL
jgi:hypothetical protein